MGQFADDGEGAGPVEGDLPAAQGFQHGGRDEATSSPRCPPFEEDDEYADHYTAQMIQSAQ
jgi:hypothetical protein